MNTYCMFLSRIKNLETDEDGRPVGRGGDTRDGQEDIKGLVLWLHEVYTWQNSLHSSNMHGL